MNDRWLASIPDQVPWEGVTEPATMIEVEKLHTRLKDAVATNKRRGIQLAEKGVILDPHAELQARMILLIDMFIGTLSIERLQFELQFQEMIAFSLEEAAAGLTQNRKSLHIPNGRKPNTTKEGNADEG